MNKESDRGKIVDLTLRSGARLHVIPLTPHFHASCREIPPFPFSDKLIKIIFPNQYLVFSPLPKSS